MNQVEKVDVLAVLDDAIDFYPEPPLSLAKLEAARAAVAELVAKAQFLVDGLDEEYVAWPTRVHMLRAAMRPFNGERA